MDYILALLHRIYRKDVKSGRNLEVGFISFCSGLHTKIWLLKDKQKYDMEEKQVRTLQRGKLNVSREKIYSTCSDLV